MSEHANDGDAPRFEGSYLGNRTRLPATARLECKICWWVYDPALGDEVWQVAPGTAFTDLPAHWRCPVCDGDAEQFMVLLDGGDSGSSSSSSSNSSDSSSNSGQA